MRLETLDQGGGYGSILADPPWTFRNWGRDVGRRSAASHYPVMSLEDIKALDVARLAAPDAALYMWATMPLLDAALDVGAAWGFAYKTCAFTWVKTTKRGAWHFGMGYWTRANAELCLLFTRGKPSRNDRGVPQLMVEQIGRHSAKPDETYRRIMRLTDGPYLELFARNHPPGWDVWGHDAPETTEGNTPWDNRNTSTSLET